MVKKFALLVLIGSGIVLYQQKTDQAGTTPAPTDTIIKYDMENGENRDLKKSWLELIHQSAPDVDWKEVEHQNMMSHYNKMSAYARRGNPQAFANGKVMGQWYEIGSSNQAGSVHATAYDNRTDELYLISDGGILFKGSSKGNDWVVMNDLIRLDRRFLTSYIDASEKLILISAIRGVPHYSEDKGITWNSSTGLPSDSRIEINKWAHIESTNELFVLHKKDYWDDANLFVSTDGGLTYINKQSFSTSDLNNIALCNPHHTEELILMEQIAEDESKIQQWDGDTEKFNVIFASSPLAWGWEGRGNLAGTLKDNEILLYTYDQSSNLHLSNNLGMSWESIAKLPARPWQVGVYVSKYDPDLLFLGEVEGFRSLNGGRDWQKIHDWWEYYSDVNGKLHADIMWYSEYEDIDGDQFLLVSNHGGLNVTRNRGLTFNNLGLDKLNVGQFYDVRSHPYDEDWVFAGTQDQGLQRTNLTDNTGPSQFDQVISGDYGHICFTDNNTKMWAVYPGGDIHYYNEAFLGQRSGSWELVSDDETVWIPPLIADPQGENKVYLAGGSVRSPRGSYIIELTPDFLDRIEPEQRPYNFLDAGKGTISAMAFNFLDPSIMYVATTNGGFFVSYDGGITFDEKNIKMPGGHYLYGACILPSRISASTIYASGSGYSTAPVIVSYDGGESFQDMSNGLPQTLAFELASNEEETLLFAATEAGPYVYVMDDEQWYHLGEDQAPAQSYWSVEYLAESDRVRYGTYGRGIWDFQLEPEVTSTADVDRDLIKIYPNPASETIEIESSSALDLMVVSTTGEMIMTLGPDQGSIDISDLRPGVYFLIDRGMTINKRFVKL